eukprot:tig00001542_g9327.t1
MDGIPLPPLPPFNDEDHPSAVADLTYTNASANAHATTRHIDTVPTSPPLCPREHKAGHGHGHGEHKEHKEHKEQQDSARQSGTFLEPARGPPPCPHPSAHVHDPDRHFEFNDALAEFERRAYESREQHAHHS